MFGQGGRLSLDRIDGDIADAVNETLAAANEFAENLPLVGLNVQAMHDIEAKGLKICQARLGEIEAEIDRLQNEARNTAAIIDASFVKLEKLRDFINPEDRRPQVAPMKHTGIVTAQSAEVREKLLASGFTAAELDGGGEGDNMTAAKQYEAEKASGAGRIGKPVDKKG